MNVKIEVILQMWEEQTGKHKTATHLAKKLGVSVVTISKWNTGKTLPNVKVLVKICQLIKVFNIKTFINFEPKKPIN